MVSSSEMVWVIIKYIKNSTKERWKDVCSTVSHQNFEHKTELKVQKSEEEKREKTI